MENAYNRLDWNFIKVCLTSFGFASKWIDWIMECISTVSFSVLVNGALDDLFSPSRGIRQADPISPYIFIICVEVLARMLQKECEKPRSPIGIKVSRTHDQLPFLTFDDDTLIFVNANLEGVNKIKSILDKYCTISGQKINYAMSYFQCTRNIPGSKKCSFKASLGMKEVATLGLYLGCHLINGRVSKQPFDEILTKTSNLLSKWKTNSLSQAGRLIHLQ